MGTDSSSYFGIEKDSIIPSHLLATVIIGGVDTPLVPFGGRKHGTVGGFVLFIFLFSWLCRVLLVAHGIF